MSIREAPEEYFRQFVPRRDALLERLEQEAAQEEIPIIGPLAGALLGLLVRATRVENVLELGTATGYSAIFLARALPEDRGQVVTLEQEQAMASRARANIREAGLETRVEIREGSALDLLADMQGPFDFIFMDIEKEEYAPALPHCERLLKPGGLLVVDNTAFPEAEEFNQALAASPAWQFVQLFSFLPAHSPEHDGLCLALRL